MEIVPSFHRRHSQAWGGLLATILALFASQTGCKSGKPAAATAAGPMLTIDPQAVGEIKGQVSLEGPAPTPRKLLLSGEPECAQLNPNGLFSPEIGVGSNGALKSVAVYIRSGLGNYHFDTPQSPAQLAQHNCMYEPRVIALMTNQTLAIQNQDPIQHNVHPTPRDNPAFNMTQPIHGPPIEKSFAEPELAIRFMCTLHPWMRAYVFVFSHPYFDVTSDAGTFDLKNVPPGSYTVEAWQEKYGTRDQTITLGPHQSETLNFVFKN